MSREAASDGGLILSEPCDEVGSTGGYGNYEDCEYAILLLSAFRPPLLTAYRICCTFSICLCHKIPDATPTPKANGMNTRNRLTIELPISLQNGDLAATNDE